MDFTAKVIKWHSQTCIYKMNVSKKKCCYGADVSIFWETLFLPFRLHLTGAQGHLRILLSKAPTAYRIKNPFPAYCFTGERNISSFEDRRDLSCFLPMLFQHFSMLFSSFFKWVRGSPRRKRRQQSQALLGLASMTRLGSGSRELYTSKLQRSKGLKPVIWLTCIPAAAVAYRAVEMKQLL